MSDSTGRSWPVRGRPDRGSRFRPGGLISSALGSPVLAPVTSVAYKWYEHHLMQEVRFSAVPTHVAMILDGNRRFAHRSGLADPTDGHLYGAEKVSEFVRWCDELLVPVVTLWALSTDNLSRNPHELSKIFEVVRDRLRVLCRDRVDGPAKRRVRVLGRLDLVPNDLRLQIEEIERQTASSGPHMLNVAVAYGGRDEILDAVKRMLRA